MKGVIHLKKTAINEEKHKEIYTLEDILSKKFFAIVFMTELNGYYYLRIAPEHNYDETVWKINKDTRQTECIHLIDYYEIIENAEPKNIDPKTLKGVS